MSVYHLRPYVKEVAARRAKNKTSAAWTILNDRWQQMVDQAMRLLEDYYGGKPCIAWQIQAADQFRLLAGAVPSEAVVDTALAMFMMREKEPMRFKSQAAFCAQLVRRVRLLGPTNVGSSWDHKRQKVRKTYRDLPPRVTVVLARHLIEAFGMAGFHLAHLPRDEDERRREQQAQLADSIAALA